MSRMSSKAKRTTSSNVPFKLPSETSSKSIFSFNPLIYKVTDGMFQNRTKTGDVMFKIGDGVVLAHKCVLAAISRKYEIQFYDGDLDDKNKQLFEVKEPCVTVVAFNEFLQFFYSSSIVLTFKNIEGVMFLAKESLVEEFYELCIKFLSEILTVENVCEIYYLAILHECTKLLEKCKTIIEENSKQVFVTDGFIHSKRSVFLNILQLVPTNIKATDLFEACIAWAKHFCTENNQDPKNNYDLRAILGDVLYSIQFKTMSIQEFMGYYCHYKNLFTDEERMEIFFLIGEVNDFKPKWFTEGKTATDYAERPDTIESIKCNRIFCDEVFNLSFFDHGEIRVSCNENIVLHEIWFPQLFVHLAHNTRTVNVKVFESISCNFLFKEKEQITFRADQQACFKFQPPIAIKRHIPFVISVELSDRVGFCNYKLENEVSLENNMKFLFNVNHSPAAPITCLKYTVLQKKEEINDK